MPAQVFQYYTVGTILKRRVIRRAINSVPHRPFPKMNIDKKEINTTTSKTTRSTIRTTIVALTVALMIMMVGSTAVTTTASTAPAYYPMTLQANGGTFVNPLMQTWAQGFQQYTSNVVKLNYQAIGTGAAQTDILANTGAFAGGDAPISAAQITAANPPATLGNLLQFPESLGGVAIFYNLPGVTTHIELTGPIIADIYVGNITMWNDPAITALNPSITFPAQLITPVHRSDGSGTTYALSNYFEKVSANWNATFTGGCPCYGTSIPSTVWGANAANVGAKGSSAVASYVLGNQYSIGYADSVYATNAGLLFASIKNQAGVFLTPTVTDITAAAAAFSAQVLANPTFTITNAPGTGSYPISTYTYLYVWSNQTNYQQGYDVAQLFEWIINQGQGFSSSLNYAPLPAGVVTVDQGIIAQMNYEGTPFMSTTVTTVTCSQASVIVGSTTTCKAAVTGSGTTLPTGKVAWSSSIAGRFSGTFCRLSKHKTYSSCTRSFTPTAVGSGLAALTASYGGDLKHSGSGNTYSLTVTPRVTKTSVSCTPHSGSVSSAKIITCKAIVKGYLPTGTVTWSQSGTGAVSLSSTTCTLQKYGPSLTKGTCSVKMTGTTAGTVTLQATYSGDSSNQGSLHTATLNIGS